MPPFNKSGVEEQCGASRSDVTLGLRGPGDRPTNAPFFASAAPSRALRGGTERYIQPPFRLSGRFSRF